MNVAVNGSPTPSVTGRLAESSGVAAAVARASAASSSNIARVSALIRSSAASAPKAAASLR